MPADGACMLVDLSAIQIEGSEPMSSATSSNQEQESAAPRIEIVDLVKTFRRVGGQSITPVDHVSLAVGVNEMVVLLGPSGCGKTTLLRCVAGLEQPDAGEIIINGEIVFSARKRIFIPANRRRISMIFQSFALWPHMTVFSNVAYPLQSVGVRREEIRPRVLEVLQLVGIAGLEEQYPGRLSGGQQQRVALARALVASSTVVLFDEPLSNVDAQVRGQLRLELKRMQRNIHFSGLYVTHDQSEAMELGHRVAVLESGRVAAIDEPRAIYERPRSEYVANFVGAANIWPGKIVGRNDGTIDVETPLGTLRSGHTGSGLSISVGKAVSVVVRPEHLALSTEKPARECNVVEVNVEARIFAGPHTEYFVNRGDASARIWSHAEVSGNQLSEGRKAWLSVDPGRITIIQAHDTSAQ
jgi:iron(III) transport system ATP-binding protein